MGGFGSGGTNRTHETIEDHKRVDSFCFQQWLEGDKYLVCKDAVVYEESVIFHPQDNTAEIKEGGQFIDLKLSNLKGIDGKTEQLYFICPFCQDRVRFLYDVNGYYQCRHCLHGNYKIQQTNGLRKLSLKMKRIVEKELHYTQWEYDYPGIRLAELPHPPRPRYMRRKQYDKLIGELEALQAEYTMLELHSLMGCMPSELRVKYKKAGIN